MLPCLQLSNFLSVVYCESPHGYCWHEYLFVKVKEFITMKTICRKLLRSDKHVRQEFSMFACTTPWHPLAIEQRCKDAVGARSRQLQRKGRKSHWGGRVARPPLVRNNEEEWLDGARIAKWRGKRATKKLCGDSYRQMSRGKSMHDSSRRSRHRPCNLHQPFSTR